MAKKYCKEGCEFLNRDSETEADCIMYSQDLKVRGNRVKRLKRCVQESYQWKLNTHIAEMGAFYDAFVCEMDAKFDELNKLLRKEE